MAEEYEILNQGATQEGGGEIPSELQQALVLVAQNMSTIIDLANSLNDEGGIVLPSIDGSVTKISINSGTAADLAGGYTPALYELVWTSDAPVDAPELKIGDGVSAWTELNNILTAADFDSSALATAVAAATTQATNSGNSADSSAASALAAAGSATLAGQKADLSQAWATQPDDGTLPGGKKSAEVHANNAAQIAQTSREIEVNPANVTADETFTAGFLYKKRRVLSASLVTITIPAGIYTNALEREAWAIYRKLGAGNVKVVAAPTGTDLVTPQIKASGTLIYRNPTNTAGVNITRPFVMAVPAITAGKLLMFVTGQSNEAGTVPMVFNQTLDNSLTSALKNTVLAVGAYEPRYALFEANLTAFPGANVTLNQEYGPNAHLLIVSWFAIEGTDGALVVTPAVQPGTGTVATVNMTALAEKSLVLGHAQMRGASPIGIASVGSSLSVLQQATTAGAEVATVTDTGNQKNAGWGRLFGTHNVAGDFSGQVTFNSSFARPGLMLAAYPPKSVPGGGAVNLLLEGGRDTLSVLHGEMELLFHSNGIDVTVKTPKP